MKRRLDEEATAATLADQAGVSRQTVYTWIARHQLTLPSAPARPSAAALAELYGELGSAQRVGDKIGVKRDTAQRWLHAAGVELRGPVDVDIAAVRQRRSDGATLAAIAAEQGVSAETIRRRLLDDR